MSDMDIARDDLALDALAAGLRPEGGDEVLGLLHALRTDLDVPGPAPVVVPLRPQRRRGFLVGLSAAAGLIVGGLTAGAVVTADEPGQLLYAAHKAVLGDPKAADRVSDLLDDALEEIAEGDLDKANDRLDKAAERLREVEDPGDRATLRARLDSLRALAAGPAPSRSGSDDDDPSESPEPRETETPEPRETESEDSSGSGSGSGDDNSGSGSDSSGKGSGSDDSSGSGSGRD